MNCILCYMRDNTAHSVPARYTVNGYSVCGNQLHIEAADEGNSLSLALDYIEENV